MAIYVKDKDRINELLIINNFTQVDLANEVGVGQSYLSSILNQHKPVGTKTANKISSLLSSNFEDIFTFKPSTKVLQN
ncbi:MULTISPECIES: helix-turn-helix transcriptional regulator [Companilactobacillus]|uniref:HTH cro/C1-type domain-containing protein n=2 Tax=Companilactobacillus TaxID=2767879 RepID=A0A1P8Q2E0_9LACO|nr:hypothetical protein BTM29_05470 [Companilactobacillus allii]